MLTITAGVRPLNFRGVFQRDGRITDFTGWTIDAYIRGSNGQELDSTQDGGSITASWLDASSGAAQIVCNAFTNDWPTGKAALVLKATSPEKVELVAPAVGFRIEWSPLSPIMGKPADSDPT